MRKWRGLLNVNQMELADELNLSPSVISDYETGRRQSPGSGFIKRYVEALLVIDQGRGGYYIRQMARITIDPNVCFGKACIRGTRVWVSLIIDNLADGVGEKEIFRKFVRGEQAKAQILIDGTDNSIVGTIMNYFNGILSAARKKLQPFYVEGGIEIVPRYLFNPEQMSPWFIIPGLSVVIISILSPVSAPCFP
jgi:hypothetical protein